jgi:hypothetical protein
MQTDALRESFEPCRQGLGDLPNGALRPLAITGEQSYGVPDRRLNSAADNNDSPASGRAAFSKVISHFGARPKRDLRDMAAVLSD